MLVAPHAGAWIETPRCELAGRFDAASRPTRARGLITRPQSRGMFRTGVTTAGAWVETPALRPLREPDLSLRTQQVAEDRWHISNGDNGGYGQTSNASNDAPAWVLGKGRTPSSANKKASRRQIRAKTNGAGSFTRHEPADIGIAVLARVYSRREPVCRAPPRRDRLRRILDSMRPR